MAKKRPSQEKKPKPSKSRRAKKKKSTDSKGSSKKLGLYNKILILLAGLALTVVIAGYYRFNQNRQSAYPYPYDKIYIDPSEVARASQADIILLGDSATQALGKQLDQFIIDTAKNLKEPLKIYNWGSSGEILPITAAKVRALKKMPLLFIYHGGLDELSKKRFYKSELPIIEKNIDLTKKDDLMSLMISAPFISRLIYTPVKRIDLLRSTSFARDIDAAKVMRILAATYQLYEFEAKELFSYLKAKDAKLWLIPQALPIEKAPGRVCENAQNQETAQALDEATRLLEARLSKEAYSVLTKALEHNKGNAYLYQLLGESLYSMGSYQAAKRAYYQKMIFDCSLGTGNPVFLKILMEQAEMRDFRVFDFNRMVTDNLGHNELFISEKLPQPLYYSELNEVLVKEFFKFLKKKN